jgi:hypothetical protein
MRSSKKEKKDGKGEKKQNAQRENGKAWERRSEEEVAAQVPRVLKKGVEGAKRERYPNAGQQTVLHERRPNEGYIGERARDGQRRSSSPTDSRRQYVDRQRKASDVSAKRGESVLNTYNKGVYRSARQSSQPADTARKGQKANR